MVFGGRSVDDSAARRVLDDGVAAGVYPAAVAEIGSSAGPQWHCASGRLTYEEDAPPASLATVFDLASLTKVIAATSLAMRLADRGALDVEAPVAAYLPAWADAAHRTVTVRDLLEHSSGLPAWAPLFQTASGPDEVASAVAALPLDFAPRERSVYSDLGFIVLGRVLETAGGLPLDQQFGALVAEVGSSDWQSLVYLPPRSWRARTAPTRVDPWRDRLLVGEVDDANAAAMGGVAAHAGLFGTARAVGAFAGQVLTECRGGSPRPRLARPGTLRAVLTRSRVPGSSRALGWDTMLPTSSCGTRMSSSAVGHTGFTGTSLWLDPEHDLYAVLLTNRVYPDGGSQEAIRRVRRAFHDAVMTDRDRWY